MGQSVSTSTFRFVGTDEPHASRRKEILKKYPEIRNLYGPDMRLFWCSLVLMAIQFTLASQAPRMPPLIFWFVAWAIGGTVAHAMSLANHELSHNLAFHTPVFNELLGVFINCAQGLPSAITFKRYHLEHHVYQGHHGVDTDIPSEFEGRVFNSTLKKIVWVFLQPLFYAIRPLVIKPKSPVLMEAINLSTVLASDLLVIRLWGPSALGYMIASTLLGMGLHPVAGHFISEHYQFTSGQETYSYYGPLNWVCFNVGYHNEHHDFPKISGFRLPEVRRIAPEYYDERWKSHDGSGLTIHSSWVKVIYDYIVDPSIGPFSRVKRHPKYAKAS